MMTLPPLSTSQSQGGSQASKLQGYLCKSVENVKNPLKWWIASQNIYPNLHCVALDYLSIPGM